jgi:ribosome-binding protein aMBF1 (putative translation factor)
MAARRLKQLRKTGWKIGSTRESLGLSDEVARLVELELSLIDPVKEARRKRGLSQVDLAQRIGSSESRVAEIEAGDPSVSFDLIICALFAVGAGARELRRAGSGTAKSRT